MTAATTVRLRHGQRQVQDGPFPDTKEQLGGFFLIDVPGGGAGPLAAPTGGSWPGSRPAAATRRRRRTPWPRTSSPPWPTGPAGAYGQAIALATDPAVARFLQERASATGAGEPLRLSPDTPVQ